MGEDTNKFYIARTRVQGLIDAIDYFEKLGLAERQSEKDYYEEALSTVINVCTDLDTELRSEIHCIITER